MVCIIFQKQIKIFNPLDAPFGYYYNLLLSNCFTSSSLVQLHDVIIKKDLLLTLDLRRLKTFSMYFSRLLIASSGQRLIASYVPLSKQTSKLCVDNLDLISETSDKISHCYKFNIYMNFGILQVKYFQVRLFLFKRHLAIRRHDTHLEYNILYISLFCYF